MKIKQLLVLTILVGLGTSCSHKTWTVSYASSTKIAIDSTTDSLQDTAYLAYLQPVKLKVDAQMSAVIGVAAETMKGHGPESLLSNFTADVYRQAATDFTGQKVDLAIVNLGGLRTIVPEGKITVGKVFELMPFENELVILWLKGTQINELMEYFAGMGGEGVSGLRMRIENSRAVDISIGDSPLEPDRLYSIATNDYLAGGNDKMTQLAAYQKRINTGLKIRNVLLDFIKTETLKGNPIQSKLDGRITVQ